MPVTRSSPRKSSSSATTSAHKLVCTTPSDRRLFLITHPTLSQRPIDHFTSITLRHPKHNSPARYLLIDHHILECQSLHPADTHSAFIDDYVLSDCRLYVATPVDPLLLALPVLAAKRQESSEKDGYFLSYDALFADASDRFPFQQWSEKQRPFAALRHVCDVRDGWDEPVYRLNNTKTLAYLTQKLTRLTTLLPTLPSNPTTQPLHTALGLLSEYVEAVWLERLCAQYGVEVEAVLKRPGKAAGGSRKEASGSEEGMEEVGADGLTERQASGERKSEKDKKKVGVSAAVKKLQKASTGTKSISSFFGKK